MSVSDERRWIVGFDGSIPSRSAAWWAVANAAGRMDSICLVRSWSVASATVYSPFEPIILAELIQSAEATGRDELESFAAELAAVSVVPVDTLLVHGDPASSLLDEARRGIQLVLGARGAGMFTRLLLGSTSLRCATHATVPTVVVRGQFDQPPAATQHLVVGFDGSDNAIAAVDWACRFASAGSKVDIVAVWEFTSSLFVVGPFRHPDAAASARQQFDEQIAALPATAQRDDITVRSSFLEGSPREQLATCAGDADLLVVGARGRGAIGSALLGSVSSWLLHRVGRPMVIVP